MGGFQVSYSVQFPNPIFTPTRWFLERHQFLYCSWMPNGGIWDWSFCTLSEPHPYPDTPVPGTSPIFYFSMKPKWGDFRSVIMYNFRTLSSPLHAGSWYVINFYIVRGGQMGGFEIGHSVHFPNHIHILTLLFLVSHQPSGFVQKHNGADSSLVFRYTFRTPSWLLTSLSPLHYSYGKQSPKGTTFLFVPFY
jgi:hypothetical protein